MPPLTGLIGSGDVPSTNMPPLTGLAVPTMRVTSKGLFTQGCACDRVHSLMDIWVPSKMLCTLPTVPRSVSYSPLATPP